MKRLVLTGVALGAALSLGCSSSPSHETSSSDAGSDAGRQVVSFQHAGSITTGWGYNLLPTVQTAAIGTAVFGATPSEPGLEASAWCRPQYDAGSCHVSFCDSQLAPTSTPSAGTITVGDAALSFPLAWVALNGDFEGGWVDGGSPWPAGALLTVHASGADVPAFDATTTVPTALVVTSPDPSGSIDITRASGMTLAWQPGDGDVVGELDQPNVDGGTGSVLLACRFPRSAGGGTIPPQAFADFAAAAAIVRLWSSVTTTVQAGDYAIEVSSTGAGLTGLVSLE